MRPPAPWIQPHYGAAILPITLQESFPSPSPIWIFQSWNSPRKPKSDPVNCNQLVHMLVNRILKHRKKKLTYQIIYQAVKRVQQKMETNPLSVFTSSNMWSNFRYSSKSKTCRWIDSSSSYWNRIYTRKSTCHSLVISTLLRHLGTFLWNSGVISLHLRSSLPKICTFRGSFRFQRSLCADGFWIFLASFISDLLVHSRNRERSPSPFPAVLCLTHRFRM